MPLRPPLGRGWTPVLVLALVGAGALGSALYLRNASGRGSPVDRAAGAAPTEEQMQQTFALLCRTRALAQSRPGDARELFYGRVHSPLHAIAAEAGEADRTVAARMLEAKNDVERALAAEPPAPATVPALDRLLASTEQALRSVEVTTSSCELP